MVTIQEEAKRALEAHQASVAEADLARLERDRERNARDLIELVQRVLEIPADDPRLPDSPQDGEITLDGLKFRLYRSSLDLGRRAVLQVRLPCYLCSEPCWQDIRDLVELGTLLSDPERIAHQGFTCQQKELVEEEAEKPAEFEPPICPIMSGNDTVFERCQKEACAWWQRCQEIPASAELAEVVERKIERPDSGPPHWAVVALMGHTTLVGRISEGYIAGITLTRIEIPTIDDRPGYIKYLSRGSIYDITPIDEQTAMAILHWHKPPRPIDWTLLPPEMRPEEVRPRPIVLHAGSEEYEVDEEEEDADLVEQL